jgi:phage gp29-like protein
VKRSGLFLAICWLSWRICAPPALAAPIGKDVSQAAELIEALHLVEAQKILGVLVSAILVGFLPWRLRERGGARRPSDPVDRG